MKTGNAVKVCIAVVVAFLLTAGWSGNVLAAGSPGEAAVSKEMVKDIGMPILDGDLWQKMTQDDKIAFIWGCWHVISIEYYLMDKYPQLKTENFSAKVVEAARKSKTPKTANELVAMIDAYYQANSDEIEKPVIAVLWDIRIKPNIETGIAGRPLKR